MRAFIDTLWLISQFCARMQRKLSQIRRPDPLFTEVTLVFHYLGRLMTQLRKNIVKT